MLCVKLLDVRRPAGAMRVREGERMIAILRDERGEVARVRC
jgi:hypothetical protein